jgi:arsenate reductase
VLFLCPDNSTRSQIGEALLRHRGGARFEACSAGLAPKPVHPLVGEVLREIGVEPAPLEAKRIGPFLGTRTIRYAVILRGGEERDAPRIFPFAARTLRWDVPDPALSPSADDDDQARERLRRTRDDIDARIRGWIGELEAETRRSPAA